MHIVTTFSHYVNDEAVTTLSHFRFILNRKTPLAVLVALGGVGDADARGGGEL
jgi:hypothetical protein